MCQPRAQEADVFEEMSMEQSIAALVSPPSLLTGCRHDLLLWHVPRQVLCHADRNRCEDRVVSCSLIGPLLQSATGAMQVGRRPLKIERMCKSTFAELPPVIVDRER